MACVPDGVHFEQHEDGVLLTVRARAGGRTNGVTGTRDGALLVSVTQVAERGKANQAVLRVLSELFACGKQRITLVRGATSPTKQYLVIGVSPQQAAACVASTLGNR